jgi:ribosomal protein L11 methyltransferase
MASQATDQAFVQIDVRLADAAAAERVAAEAYEAGAVGLEERDEEDAIVLRIYAPRRLAARLRRALAATPGSGAVGAALRVPAEDWPETWKRGLGASVISSRLVVRPSFVPLELAPGQAELVIDPGQAFGTGAHESTWLALEWIDAVAPGLGPGARVLDVGCGSGVLALAALRRGAARAVACDVDPLAAEATRANARVNALEERIAVFTGSLAALGARDFELVVANLLRSELLPLIEAIAAVTRPGGAGVISGLLGSESDAVEAALRAGGLVGLGTRDRRDASGALWRAWLTRRA